MDLVSLGIYVFYAVIVYMNFDKLSVITFTLVFYILPPIINGFLRLTRKTTGTDKILAYGYAFGMYLGIGILTETNGMWKDFVVSNSYNIDDVNVEISSSMVEPSQIIFVFILYFGVGYLIERIIDKRRAKNESISCKQPIKEIQS